MIKVKLTTEHGVLERPYDDEALLQFDWNYEIENLSDCIKKGLNHNF